MRNAGWPYHAPQEGAPKEEGMESRKPGMRQNVRLFLLESGQPTLARMSIAFNEMHKTARCGGGKGETRL